MPKEAKEEGVRGSRGMVMGGVDEIDGKAMARSGSEFWRDLTTK